MPVATRPGETAAAGSRKLVDTRRQREDVIILRTAAARSRA
jgi:hypothetical protein